MLLEAGFRQLFSVLLGGATGGWGALAAIGGGLFLQGIWGGYGGTTYYWTGTYTRGGGPAEGTPEFKPPGYQAGAYFTQPTILVGRIAEREPEFILPEGKLRRIIREEAPSINIVVHTHDPSTWIEAWDRRAITVLNRKLERGV